MGRRIAAKQAAAAEEDMVHSVIVGRIRALVSAGHNLVAMLAVVGVDTAHKDSDVRSLVTSAKSCSPGDGRVQIAKAKLYTVERGDILMAMAKTRFVVEGVEFLTAAMAVVVAAMGFLKAEKLV